MRKILFVGNMDENINGISTYLAQYFQVKFCTANVDILQGIIKVLYPDMVVINLNGDENCEEIFYCLYQNYKKMPVLTLGSEEQKNPYLRYYKDEQFVHVDSNTDINTACRKCLEVLKETMNVDAGVLTGTTGIKKTVLVVDDNPVLLRNVKMMLNDYYNVTVAASGIQGIQAIKKKRPDLILLDYEMPELNGKRVLELLRADEDKKNIPIIFLTGVSDTQHVEEVVKLRPNGYILKPPVAEELINSIRRVIG